VAERCRGPAETRRAPRRMTSPGKVGALGSFGCSRCAPCAPGRKPLLIMTTLKCQGLEFMSYSPPLEAAGHP